MKYSFLARNTGKDKILQTRLRLFKQLNINHNKSPVLYSYYWSAYLSNILI